MGRGVGGPGAERCPGLGCGCTAAGCAWEAGILRLVWERKMLRMPRWRLSRGGGWETGGGTRRSEWRGVKVGEGEKGCRQGCRRLAGTVEEENGC